MTLFFRKMGFRWEYHKKVDLPPDLYKIRRPAYVFVQIWGVVAKIVYKTTMKNIYNIYIYTTDGVINHINQIIYTY
jgi:hypothetical protein